MEHQELIIGKFPKINKNYTFFVLNMHLYGTAGAVRIASQLY